MLSWNWSRFSPWFFPCWPQLSIRTRFESRQKLREGSFGSLRTATWLGYEPTYAIGSCIMFPEEKRALSLSNCPNFAHQHICMAQFNPGMEVNSMNLLNFEWCCKLTSVSTHRSVGQWMNVFKISRIQLANISPHPASSRKCRSSNQVVWLWLKVCHMVTTLAFKYIGLFFLSTGFQRVDGSATRTLRWKYFSPRFDILVHPRPSSHAKHVLTAMQMKDVCVMLKRRCCR